jgi:hypothetical protein
MISSLVVIPLLSGSWLSWRSPEFVIGVCIIATAPVTVAAGTVMTDLGRATSPSLFHLRVKFLAALPSLFLKLLLSFGNEIELPVLRCSSGLRSPSSPTILGQLVRPGRES